MKKLLFVIIALTLVATGAFALEFQAGVLVEGVSPAIGSLDLRMDFGPVTAEAALGFTTFKFANPTVMVNGTALTMPWSNLSLDAYGLMGELDLFVNWWRPANVVIYSGVGGTVGLLGANFNVRVGSASTYDDITVKLGGTIWNVKGTLLGADFKIPGVSNVVFSFGGGVLYWFLPDLTGSLTVDNELPAAPVVNDIKVNPGLSGFSSFVEFGVRVAFPLDQTGKK
jgi:hypothetical protein